MEKIQELNIEELELVEDFSEELESQPEKVGSYEIDNIINIDNIKISQKEKILADLTFLRGFKPVEAYSIAYNKPFKECSQDANRIRNLVNKTLNKPNVSEYLLYLKNLRDRDLASKGLWHKEKAEKTLLNLIEKTENELYEQDRPINMGRVNAIIMSVKELNVINGLNTPMIKLQNEVVSFSGEDELT